MIQNFEQIFPELYGRSSVTYNVHNLLHITDCVYEFGDLNNISAYNFENFMQKIKRNIKMPKHLCQQIYNKFTTKGVVNKLPTKVQKWPSQVNIFTKWLLQRYESGQRLFNKRPNIFNDNKNRKQK